MNSLALLGLEADNGTYVVLLLLCCIRKLAIYECVDILERLVELYNKVILEILAYAAAIACCVAV